MIGKVLVLLFLLSSIDCDKVRKSIDYANGEKESSLKWFILQQINSFGSKIDKIQEEASQREKQLNGLMKEFSDYKQRDSDANGSVKHELGVIRKLVNDADAKLGNKIDDLQTHMTDIINKGGPVSPIMFHAVKSKAEYYKNHVIIFDIVKTNIGEGYDVHSGMFTAPKKGVYLFSAHVSTIPGQHIHIALCKNGEVYNVGWASSDVATIVRPLLLNVKDKVWIRHIRGEQEYVYPNYTYFSGTLLQSL